MNGLRCEGYRSGWGDGTGIRLCVDHNMVLGLVVDDTADGGCRDNSLTVLSPGTGSLALLGMSAEVGVVEANYLGLQHAEVWTVAGCC